MCLHYGQTLISLFDRRNTAEHEKEITYAAYMGIFDLMAQTINCFSDTPIPDEIQLICNGETKTAEKNKMAEISKVKASKTDENKTQSADMAESATTKDAEKVKASTKTQKIKTTRCKRCYYCKNNIEWCRYAESQDSVENPCRFYVAT